MTKQTTKSEYEQWVDEDVELTDGYMEKIDNQFNKLLKDPNNKNSKTFDTMLSALIALWLTDLSKQMKKQMRTASSRGIAIARQQLKQKDITKIVKKSLDNKKIKDGLNANIELLERDLAYVSSSVSGNAKRIISEIKNNVLETKKQLSEDLKNAYSAYGVTFYYDRAGKRHKISDYIKQKSLTVIADSMRRSYLKTALRYGVDLVRIVHLNIHPHCPLCSPFDNKIVSISGKTKGYMTWAEACMAGIGHNFCDDIPMNFELAPTDSGNDGNITLSEENKKRIAYNKKRGYNFHL
jgi:hypothetical protein